MAPGGGAGQHLVRTGSLSAAELALQQLLLLLQAAVEQLLRGGLLVGGLLLRDGEVHSPVSARQQRSLFLQTRYRAKERGDEMGERRIEAIAAKG